MCKDVSNYCNHCLTCQQTKALTTHPVPLHPVVASYSANITPRKPVNACGAGLLFKLALYHIFIRSKTDTIVQILKAHVFTMV